MFGALGLQTEVDFQRKRENSNHLLTPKVLLKLSPGSMRKESRVKVNTY